MEISGPPQGEVSVPAPIARVAGGRPAVAVWLNNRGGTAFRLGEGELYAKWAPAGADLDLAAEAERLAWAAQYTPVPRPVDHGSDPDGSWLVTEGLPGESAVSPRWQGDPGTAVRALGRGLRALHDRLPVDACPFSWSVELRRGHPDVPADLPDPPAVDRLVVCHGDACAPNTLLDADGSWAAHVDLGALGLADRWADLAIGAWSTTLNYGPGWEELYYASYGVAPDRERIAYYRRLGGLS
ncbi:aminoglycoside 3'-phosphotransferase [Streptomyces sp. NRRL F-5123]|uniref:aminoglycoside 3'-phosphotransferase n=1 Tax=Streptomyces sp. NRRL F-5123 TaxID=1463856 RepID=UPI0004E0BEF8|nr:aminoglycoside 3'-phosphotransferase [Streptomyces sp. NRRL F-5123]